MPNKACSGRFTDLIPRHHVKKLAKLEPSPVILDSEGIGGIIEAGKFSDVWAPREYRGRRLYVALFHATLRPSPSDPPTSPGAKALAIHGLMHSVCGPNTQNADWGTCRDPSYEACSQGTAISTLYSDSYWSDMYGPYLVVLSSTPSSSSDLNAVASHAQPCPVSGVPRIADKPLMSGLVYLRAHGCQDTANKVWYTRFSAEDRSTNTYTIAGGALSLGTENSVLHLFVYMLPSSTTKGSADVYYYIYHIGVPYEIA